MLDATLLKSVFTKTEGVPGCSAELTRLTEHHISDNLVYLATATTEAGYASCLAAGLMNHRSIKFLELQNACFPAKFFVNKFFSVIPKCFARVFVL